jgi:methyl-accepting chemotaxis protein
VKTLAGRTAIATTEIARMIEQIQREAARAVGTMDRVTEQVENGKALVDRAGTALGAIITNSEHVLASIQEVAEASEEQAQSASHISRNIDLISTVTRTTAEGNQAISRSVQELNALIEDLQARVSRFRVGGAGHSTASARDGSSGPGFVAAA